MRTIVFVLFILVFVAAAWSGLWFYAAHEAGTQFDAWLKAEDGRGRSWTCPNRVIDGYPLALALHCARPTFSGGDDSRTVTASVAGVVVEAALAHPRRLDIALQSPLTYRTSDGQADVRATWSSLGIGLAGLPDVQSTNLSGTDIAVDGNFGDSGRQGGRAGRLDGTFTLDAQDQSPLGFTIAIGGAAMPVLDNFLGGQAPVDIDLAGSLDHVDIVGARTPEEAIEAWRQAGGQFDLTSSRLHRADSIVTGAGTLSLDGAHRPQGRIDASFVGLEPVLKRYGISGNLAAAGSLLSALFGGGHASAAPTVPGALNLPISLKDGHLGIGPIRTPIEVPPLY